MDTSRSDGGRRVLVAVDGSEASIEALRQGHRMAVLLGDDLVAVTAWQPFRRIVLPPTSTHPRDAAEQLVANSILAAFRHHPAPKVEISALEGDPAEILVRLSRDADMLVVGSRGHSGLAGTLLGSVSGACAAHAQCPVLVVHAPVAPAVAGSASTGLVAVPADGRIVVTF
jgi:nucleotide-binding universal stress UspA family protein